MDTTDTTTATHSCGSIWHSRNVHGTLVLVLVLLAAFLFAETIKSFKEYRYVGGGLPAQNAISVSGEGEVFALPDTAEFTFSVVEEGATVAEVQEAANEKIDSALEALREKGIEEKDMKTTSFELHPKYTWQPPTCVRYPCDRKQVQAGFSLNQSVRVKVRDLEKAGEVLEGVTATGVQSVSGLSFTIADEDDKKAEARKLAIDEAREKAETLARDLGVSIVRIVGFNEDAAYPMPYMARGMEDSMATGLGGAVESKAAEIPAGENRIVSNVMITYEIR